jgi:hypothetical protein
MRTQLTKIAFTATLALALAFTFSCSSGDENDGGGGNGNGTGNNSSSNLSDLPTQAYLIVWDDDYNYVVTKDKYNGSSEITLRIPFYGQGGCSGESCTCIDYSSGAGHECSMDEYQRYNSKPAGKIKDGKVSLNLPDISEYLTSFSFVFVDGVFFPENLAWYPAVDDRREPSVTIPGKTGCWLTLGWVGETNVSVIGFLSYFSKSGKITGCYSFNGRCLNFDMNISKGWDVVCAYANNNSDDNDTYYTSDLSKIGGAWEWWIGCDQTKGTMSTINSSSKTIQPLSKENKQ